MRRLFLTILVLPVLVLLTLGTTTASGMLPPLQRADTPSWTWPLDPQPRVITPFRPPPQPWKRGHRGVDLRAHEGQGVLSPADGTVRFAGMVAGRPVLSIQHSGGRVSSFEPVTTGLSAGTPVSRGQRIGQVHGSAHCAQTCLHWGVFTAREAPGPEDSPVSASSDRVYHDPLVFVGSDSRPSVLLPVRRSPRPR